MNLFGILFTIVTCVLVLRLPRKSAALPLLLVAVYLTRAQEIDIGMHLPAVRILVAVGIIRTFINGERLSGGWTSLDSAVRLWAIWEVFSSVFHRSDVLFFRLGVAYDFVAVYYLLRVFIEGVEDIRAIFKMICILFAPLAVSMLIEKTHGFNCLSLIGFGPTEVATTNDHFRAQGAFGHPILAGTIGAVCLPMAVYFWRVDRRLAVLGIFATLGAVYASGSTGPILATLAVIAAMSLWCIRGQMGTIRWLAFALIAALSFVMNDPVYYLMARIDITGGSTGYFRAQLIRSALNHLSEWWLAGTDFTRHWMQSGIAGNADHTDMTNFFIQMGVWGGLPLMFIFSWILTVAFLRIGKALRANRSESLNRQFQIWVLGSILFGHAVAFWSISYFDQSIVFLSLVLASIGSLRIIQRAPVANSRTGRARGGTEQQSVALATARVNFWEKTCLNGI